MAEEQGKDSWRMVHKHLEGASVRSVHKKKQSMVLPVMRFNLLIMGFLQVM